MIWTTIALFVVSFLAAALFAPKPEFEDARAGSLEDVDFPRATEDAPIPLACGLVRMKAPNTLWYGNWVARKISKKVKTGLLSSSRVVVGHKYDMTLDLGLCLGEDVQLRQIDIDGQTVWEGFSTAVDEYSGSINAASIFGGHKSGGGWIGDFKFYRGSFTQPINSHIENSEEVGVGNVPAYRGMSHIVFENNYIGESNSLRAMSFVLARYTNGLGTVNNGRIGDDVNPMEILYQLSVSEWTGVGISVDELDLENLREIGAQLFTEGNGMSVLVTSAQQAKKLVQEIMRQIDGMMFQDPETGKLRVKLIRNDYDSNDLPVYDEDDIMQVRTFTKTAWEDVVSQVKVSFPQRDKDSSAVAISQDLATATMIGRQKTVTVSFPFCYNPDLANELASRERSQLSVPLFRMTLEMRRSGYGIRPGDAFKIDWPEYGLSGLVMRAQGIDLGELMNNRVVVNCVQDTFAVNTAVFSPPIASTWIQPQTSPQAILTAIVADIPTFFAKKIEFPVADGAAQPYVIPLRPSSSSSGYTVVNGATSGDLDIDDPDDADYASTAVLADDYSAIAGQVSGIDATGFTVTSRTGLFEPATDESVMLRGEEGILLVGDEFMGFLNVTNDAGASFTNVYRGLFGSSVRSHTAGTRVYQITPSMFGQGLVSDEMAAGDTWYYKLLDSVGGATTDPDAIAEESFVTSDTHNKPQRPRNAQLNASRDVSITVLADATLTWVPTARTTGVSYAKETDAAQSPAESETYRVDVLLDGALNASLSDSDVSGTSYAVPFSTLSPPVEAECEIRIFAKRTDVSLQSDGYATLIVPVIVEGDKVLLSGDEQSGTDSIRVSGDAQTGPDDDLLVSGT